MAHASNKTAVYAGRNSSLNKIAAGKTSAARKKRAAEIACLLQVTLDIEKVITLFAGEVRKAMVYKSFYYEESSTNTKIDSGAPARHSCTYNLTIEHDSLGQLTFTRGKRFSDDEILELENLLVSLVYPLRNAIYYQRALQGALTDPLTGLANRTAMMTALDREIRLARRNQSPLSLIVLDVDKFKRINDEYGHIAGDAVLVALAACLKKSVRTTDIISRFGGEEFSVLLVGANTHSAGMLAERIRANVEAFVLPYKNQDILITVSLGVASLRDEEDERGFFDRADKVLYRAKREGGNKIAAAE